MCRSVQQAGSRTTGMKAAERLPVVTMSFSKLSLRGDGLPRGASFVVASVALSTLFLLTGALTLLTRTPSNLVKHLTDGLADFTTDGWNSNTAPPGCDPDTAKLKVFMYDLPPQFHYGMIAEFAREPGQVWPKNITDIPRYPGGLHQQHSPEYWLVTDVLTSDMPGRTSPCTAFRVRRWQDADVILVPFFASLSYNRYTRSSQQQGPDTNQALQEQLLAFLESQPAWAAADGEHHVIIMHHPNSMVQSRDRFRRAMFVLADFGRFETAVANIRKDTVAPYKHVIPSLLEESNIASAAIFDSRPTLMFFQGAIVRKEGGVIRRELHALLHAEPDVIFATGATTSAGFRGATAGMRSSKFCLHLAGDTPSSNRLFDAVASHCVPLIISDEIELPFEDVIDYNEFCLFVSSTQALQKGYLLNVLRSFSRDEWAKMHARLMEVERHFQWQHPTELGDAVHMTWEAVGRKVPALTLARNKRRRYELSEYRGANLGVREPDRSS